MPDSHPICTERLQLGDVVVDPRTLRVMRANGTEQARLTPKTLAIFLELAAAPQQMLTRDELLDRVWSDSSPTADALSQAIRELRRALGDNARAPRFVETVHGVGYRLCLPVVRLRLSEGNDGAAVGGDEATEQAGSTSQVREGSARPRTFLVASFAAGLALAMLVFWWPVDRNPDLLIAPPITLLTSEPGAEEFPRLSPDGKHVVYTVRPAIGDRFDLQRQPIEGGPAKALTQTPSVDELMPAWSPDGRWIAFMRIEDDGCTIERMPADGGASDPLAGCDRVVYGGIDWHPDGRSLVASLPSATPGREPRLHRIAQDGSGAVPIDYQAEGTGWDRDPAWSPDGRWIAFRRGVPPDYDLHVVAAEGGLARRLSNNGRIGEGLAWQPDGSRIIAAVNHAGRSSLHAFDARGRGRVSLGILDAARPHAAGGQLVFHRQRMRVQMFALPLKGEGELDQALAASTGSVRLIAGAPDGERIAYLSDRAGSEQLWVGDLRDGPGRVYPHPPDLHLTSLDWGDDGDSLLVVWSGEGADTAMRLHLDSGRWEPLDLQRPLLRDLVHGADADELYAICRQGEHSLVTRLRRDDRGWTEQVSEVHVTELIRVPGRAGVFGRTPVKPNEIVAIDTELRGRSIPLVPRVYGWTAGPDGAIWYVSSIRRAVAELHRLDLSDGSSRRLRATPHEFPRRRAAIAMRGDSIVLGLLADDDTDVGMVAIEDLIQGRR